MASCTKQSMSLTNAWIVSDFDIVLEIDWQRVPTLYGERENYSTVYIFKCSVLYSLESAEETVWTVVVLVVNCPLHWWYTLQGSTEPWNL